MGSEKLRILVGDDHGVVRLGIVRALMQNFPEAEFGEAENGAEILRLVNESGWNIIILDINMPGRSGLEVLKELKESHPGIPVIIFSMYPEDQFAVRAIKAGASAYLSKNISSKELTEAIKKILSGGTYLTPSIADLIANEIRHDHDKPSHETLSDREYQVLILIASGKSVSIIGQELCLSVKTISVYRANILKKMNLKNNSEITRYAFEHELVS